MQYWLVKSEPASYGWEDFEKDGRTSWTGVRNFAARNHLRAMKRGDRVLFYESVTGKSVRGVAEVSKEAFRDATADDGDWSAVELKHVEALSRPVSLEAIKSEPALGRMVLLRQGRLSVTPVVAAEYKKILEMGGV
jgi:predicted RNA-binding protein with PUA-like domain